MPNRTEEEIRQAAYTALLGIENASAGLYTIVLRTPDKAGPRDVLEELYEQSNRLSEEMQAALEALLGTQAVHRMMVRIAEE